MPAGVKAGIGTTSKRSMFPLFLNETFTLLFDRPVDGTYCQVTGSFLLLVMHVLQSGLYI